jgi:hypothetical protein
VATDVQPLDPDVVRRYQRPAVIAGAVGLVLCALGWLVSPDPFFRSYIWAYCYFLGLALGSLAIIFLQFLTGGVWGLIIRRILEAATRTLPVLALLFLPLAAGLVIPSRVASDVSSDHRPPAISGVYIWSNPAFVEHMTHESHEQEMKYRYYLNVPFFLGRAAVCFAVWIVLMFLLNRWSMEMDRPDIGEREPRKLRMLSAAGLVLYGLTVTVMAIDWIMSLEPQWVSSIFGPLIGMGQVLNALSMAVVVLVLVGDRPPLASAVGRPVLRDLGSLMLAFVMVWAYMAFSQLLLIWSGNLPSETPYYLRRIQGGWQVFAVALALLNFAAPFVLLLMHDVKRHRGAILRVAALLLIMRAVDLYWLIMPAHPGEDGLGYAPFVLNWTDMVAPLGVGGIWLAAFLAQLQQRPLLPTHDPRMAEAVHHE